MPSSTLLLSCSKQDGLCGEVKNLFGVWPGFSLILAIVRMNKLRKPGQGASWDGPRGATSPQVQSRTMLYAQAALVPIKVTATQSNPASATVKATGGLPPHVKPTTAAEQYWAARALTAETLLSARLAHHGELLALSAEEEEKRAVRPSLLQRSSGELTHAIAARDCNRAARA